MALRSQIDCMMILVWLQQSNGCNHIILLKACNLVCSWYQQLLYALLALGCPPDVSCGICRTSAPAVPSPSMRRRELGRKSNSPEPSPIMRRKTPTNDRYGSHSSSMWVALVLSSLVLWRLLCFGCDCCLVGAEKNTHQWSLQQPLQLCVNSPCFAIFCFCGNCCVFVVIVVWLVWKKPHQWSLQQPLQLCVNSPCFAIFVSAAIVVFLLWLLFGWCGKKHTNDHCSSHSSSVWIALVLPFLLLRQLLCFCCDCCLVGAKKLTTIAKAATPALCEWPLFCHFVVVVIVVFWLWLLLVCVLRSSLFWVWWSCVGNVGLWQHGKQSWWQACYIKETPTLDSKLHQGSPHLFKNSHSSVCVPDHRKPAKGNTCKRSTSSGQLASLCGVPFNSQMLLMWQWCFHRRCPVVGHPLWCWFFSSPCTQL